MIIFVTDKEKDREKNPISQIGTSDAQNAKRVELALHAYTHTSNGLPVAAFCLKSEKKHISGHIQVRQTQKTIGTHMGNGTKRVLHVLYC